MTTGWQTVDEEGATILRRRRIDSAVARRANGESLR